MKDFTLSIDAFRERYIHLAAAALANDKREIEAVVKAYEAVFDAPGK